MVLIKSKITKIPNAEKNSKRKVTKIPNAEENSKRKVPNTPNELNKCLKLGHSSQHCVIISITIKQRNM